MAEKIMKTKPLYQRENFIITEFDAEDIITTSGVNPDQEDPTAPSTERENAYGSYNYFDLPGSWF